MNTTKKKRFYGSLLSMLAGVLMIWSLSAAPVAAAKKPVCPKTQTVYFWVTENTFLENCTKHIYIKDLASNATFSNLKSSNKRIRVSHRNGINAVTLEVANAFIAERNFTSTISFDVKQGGRKYHLSCKVSFKKRPRIFSSLKIGSREYRSYFGNYDWIMDDVFVGKTLKKVVVKPASGVKLDKITAILANDKKVTLKNGASYRANSITEMRIYYSYRKKPTYYKTPSKSYLSRYGSPLQDNIVIWAI